MSETVNPKFLELARHLRQFTQKEAAELLGVSQGKLSKAEKGLQPLPSDIIENLQTVFNLPLSFFYQSTDASQVGHLYYRRQMSIPAKVLDALDAQIRVQKMAIDQMFDAIELPEFDWQFEQPSDELTPAEIARRTRYSLGLHRGAIGNLTVLLEDHGVIIQKWISAQKRWTDLLLLQIEVEESSFSIQECQMIECAFHLHMNWGI